MVCITLLSMLATLSSDDFNVFKPYMHAAANFHYNDIKAGAHKTPALLLPEKQKHTLSP